MTNALRCLACLVFCFSPVPTATVMAEDPQPVGDILTASEGDWEFAPEYSDEFDGSQIDTKKWNINTEDWGTWSWEPENATLKDGSLHLQMVQETHQRGNQELFYKSGIARGYGTATYGYFEAKVKSCSLYPGACPSFWLHSKGPQLRYNAKDGETVAYSEIDVIELQQCEFDNETKKRTLVNRIDCNLHGVLMKDGQRQWIRPNKNPDMCKNEYDAPWDPRDDYHVYAVDNNPDFVVWYIDGKEVARKPNLYWHLPMHVTLSLGLRHPFEAYNGDAREPVASATTKDGFPTAMSVDYVRVWKNSKVAEPIGQPTAGTKKPASKKMKNGANDQTKEDFVAMEKAKWEQHGWKWNQDKVESNFAEMDVNDDGIATGLERQNWFAQKKSGGASTKATTSEQPKASMEKPAPQKKEKMAATDQTKEDFVAKEKTKWEQNGWNWNQEKVESNFDEMDADQDGIATGLERKNWFAKKKAAGNQ